MLFCDFRDAELIELAELVGRRVYGLALGYEDLNDHDELRRDPLLAVLVEKKDLTGEDRRRASDQDRARQEYAQPAGVWGDAKRGEEAL